eukprot:gnl/TRDRNA2_/TRDRNA2_47799_c0_seq1.p1 gnl/TRDRNA2_/TRDRNA2_47799_c0~~gnl/TRDRNA2_/TRDRNA2_47799_c0_seq1.p1  ORF type:complete len:696 (+),score=165.32 gnl/TRDRNA2_/TRDRNA2_47799_c0_seq1:93-2180(+)
MAFRHSVSMANGGAPGLGSPEGSRGKDALALKDDGRFLSSYGFSFNGGSIVKPKLEASWGSNSLTGLRVTGPSRRKEPLAIGATLMRKSASEASIPFPTKSAKQAPAVSTVGAPPAEGSVVSRESRRKMMELLAHPDLEPIVGQIFRRHDKDKSSKLELGELRQVLRYMHEDLNLPEPDFAMAESLFKKFDVNNSGCLDFREFMELFVAMLKRHTFDRGHLLGRDFFVNKQTGNIWNTYERKKELGAGTFGKAYLCKHRGSNEEWVVKSVKKSRAKLPVEEVEKEIMIMRQVDHPHVIRLHEWHEDQNNVYLVLEPLKGGTLRDVVIGLQKAAKGLRESWIRKVMRQSMEAMAYCHSLRLIHKDLKDENIMLLRKDPNYDEPFVVIIDLGIAEMFSVGDPTGKELGGTPLTMAPEVWNGNFGPKCDVWSLGVVMYELLTGNMPFMATSLVPQAWTRLHKRGPDWGLIKTSPESRNLCKATLIYADSQRPTLAKCLTHEWFKTEPRDLKVVPPEKLTPLKDFCREVAVKRALLLEIASKLPMDRAGRVVEIFEKFDTNDDGNLSKREVKAMFNEMGIGGDELIEKTFTALDVCKDGMLSFSEFTAGVLVLFKDLMEDRLYATFQHFDRDNDGCLDSEEVREFFANASFLLKDEQSQRSGELLQSILKVGRAKTSYAELRDKIIGPPSAGKSAKPSA